MVAIGTLVQLRPEDDRAELDRVSAFFEEVGLRSRPTDISIDGGDSRAIEAVAMASLDYDFIDNSGVPVDADIIAGALGSLG